MEGLFLHVLQRIFYAEKQIVRALPDLIQKATSPELRNAFEDHLAETRAHVSRLEQIFELLGEAPTHTNSSAIDGILDEAKEIAAEVADKAVLDAALLAAAQFVEHYEINCYGTLIAWAEELEREAVARLLANTLQEEKATDQRLTAIARTKLNANAVS